MTAQDTGVYYGMFGKKTRPREGDTWHSKSVPDRLEDPTRCGKRTGKKKGSRLHENIAEYYIGVGVIQYLTDHAPPMAPGRATRVIPLLLYCKNEPTPSSSSQSLTFGVQLS